MWIYWAAGVSMGDGSALVCGGYSAKTYSYTAQCNYVDLATLNVSAAPPLPEPLVDHQVCLLVEVPRFDVFDARASRARSDRLSDRYDFFPKISNGSKCA